MFEKFLGKKKSIQRGLVKDIVIGDVLVLIATIIGFFLIVDNQALERLVQVNVTSSEEIKEITSIIRRTIFLLVLNSIFISAVIVRVTSKRMLLPIKKISGAAKKVAAGDFSIKLETYREDEIGELTNNFNDMVKDLGSIESLQKEFVDNVSHEIKTPITSIQGFAQLLRDDNISKEEKNEYIDIIEEESNRLLNLSTSMLKLSKLQNQNKITNAEQIDISEQIRKALSILEPKWREKEIVFNISMENKYFYGDEDLIFQVWINLLENAIKFSEQKGKIDIILKEKDNWIEIVIKDYGIGMDEEEKKKVFTRFYQIDKSHSGKGSGLGLAIVKRIIELSKGEIKIESEKNMGTTIIIKLPIEKNEVLIV
ncbi:MAG: HAMP domain-containing histidine kinase [Clostridiales bacterium]|nr:HAMP domain-containing histidine kinase [Clostridiales bacterium]